MSLPNRSVCRFAGVAFLLAIASPLQAGECDIIDGFLNAEGALTLRNYSIADAVNGATTLAAGDDRGECQVSRVAMNTLPASLTSDVGDGQTRQRIRVVSSGIVSGSYASHFSIAAPEMAGSSSPRELVFQETTFSNAAEAKKAGKLIFSLNARADPSGANVSWALTSRLTNGLSGTGEEGTDVVLHTNRALLNGVPVAATQGFDGYLELVPSPSPTRVRLKVTQRPFGGSPEAYFVDLPAGTFPLNRSQGLIGQSNIPSNQLFLISNMGSARPSGMGD